MADFTHDISIAIMINDLPKVREIFPKYDMNTDDGNILIASSFLGRLEIVKFLVENGVDRTKYNTALYFAITSNFIEVVKYLVENGADVNSIDPNSLHGEMLEYLSEQGLKY